MTVENG